MKANHGYAAGRWRTDEPPKMGKEILAIFRHSGRMIGAPRVCIAWFGKEHGYWYIKGSLWAIDYDPVKWAYIYDENEPVSEETGS